MKFALLHLLLSLFPLGIVRRADVSDDQYLELGARYRAVVAIGRTGDATLISPHWLLTAAHVARAVENGRVGRRIRIGEEQFDVDRVVLHPSWREFGAHDVGLIRLARPVASVESIGLYRDSWEPGRIATLVGHGAAGTGDTRTRIDDGRVRGATSRIDSVSADWLYFSFDAPPSGTTLEGAPGRGDSGGPAIITVGGRNLVAGVSSAGFDGRNGPATYGAVDVFTRISAHAGWIDSVMAAEHVAASDERATAPSTTADTVLPDTPVGRRFAAFLRAVRDGSDSAMARFVHENFEEREHNTRPALIPNLQRIAGLLRGASVDAIVRSEPLQLSVRFKAMDTPVTIELVSGAAAPHKLVDWRRYD